MNTKTILGISLTAAFAVSMILAQSAIAMSENALPGYRDIAGFDSSTATVNEVDFFKATINTDNPVVHNGQKGAYGFGIFTDGSSTALALTTHMCASDTLVQGNAPDARCPNTIGLLDALFEPGLNAVHDDATFHAHMLVVTGNLSSNTAGFETDCSSVPNTFAKVDLGGSVAYQGAAYLSPDWPVKVMGKTIMVGNVPVDAFEGDPEILDAVVSFGIGPEWNQAGTITALCLTNPP
jgi:hypothetical protein